MNESINIVHLQQLVAKGGSLECRDSVGARPLHIAAANGYLSVVEFLLDQHVTTDSKDNDGWQPIHAAACWLHVHTDIYNSYHIRQHISLTFATLFQLEVVELLVQNGADLNAQTKNQETPHGNRIEFEKKKNQNSYIHHDDFCRYL